MARAMGIPATESATGPNPGAPTLMRNGHPDDYVGIGNYPVRILDQAVGYATLADGGQYRPSYFIQKVTDSKGNVLYQHKDDAEAGDRSQGRQRRHAVDGAGGADLRDRAGQRPAGRGQDRHRGHPGHRRLQRRLDGRLHPAGQRRVLGRLGQGGADLQRERQLRVRPGPGRASPGRRS